MTIKTELFALGVRILADKTSLIQKPDAFSAFLYELIDGESYDRKIARKVEEEITQASTALRQRIGSRKWKKITTL